MDFKFPLTWYVILSLATALVLTLIALFKLTSAYGRLRSQKRGGEVRRGFMTEQWLPLVTPYPWNPQNFRFLGSPIDGVQFEDDEIVFVEFKSGKSHLSSKQTNIKEMVNAGKVSFQEVRISVKEGELKDIDIR